MLNIITDIEKSPQNYTDVFNATIIDSLYKKCAALMPGAYMYTNTFM